MNKENIIKYLKEKGAVESKLPYYDYEIPMLDNGLLSISLRNNSITIKMDKDAKEFIDNKNLTLKSYRKDSKIIKIEGTEDDVLFELKDTLNSILNNTVVEFEDNINDKNYDVSDISYFLKKESNDYQLKKYVEDRISIFFADLYDSIYSNIHDFKQNLDDLAWKHFEIDISSTAIDNKSIIKTRNNIYNKYLNEHVLKCSTFIHESTTNDDIYLPNSNLLLCDIGYDINGNKIIKVKYVNNRAFSIQINGNLPNTKYIVSGIVKRNDLLSLQDSDLTKISKDVCEYIKKFGSDKQKNKLKCY